jgi:hypothetical protein
VERAQPKGVNAQCRTKTKLTPADSSIYAGMRRPSADVSTTELGSLFRYDIEGKVTVKDNHSTMVASSNAPGAGARSMAVQDATTPIRPEDETPYRAIRLRTLPGCL